MEFLFIRLRPKRSRWLRGFYSEGSLAMGFLLERRICVEPFLFLARLPATLISSLNLRQSA
jgi:hypothetical protein